MPNAGSGSGGVCCGTRGRRGDNRAMSVEDVRESHQHLLKELNEERVAALSRIARTLEALIAELRDRRERLAALEGAHRAAEAARYRDLHARAVKYRWYLEVQREALGLRPHPSLDEFYRVPAPVE